PPPLGELPLGQDSAADLAHRTPPSACHVNLPPRFLAPPPRRSAAPARRQSPTHRRGPGDAAPPRCASALAGPEAGGWAVRGTAGGGAAWCRAPARGKAPCRPGPAPG